MQKEEKMTDNINKNIILGLEKINQAFRAILWDITKKEGLSPLQIQILEYLYRSPKEARTISHTAKEFDLKKSTISESIKSLVNKHLVYKETDESDGRIHYLLLTNEGKAVIDNFAGYFSTIEEELENIPYEKKLIVSGFLIDLIRHLHHKGQIQVAKVCSNCSNFHSNKNKNSDKPHYCSFAEIYIGNENIKYNCKHYKK